MKTINKILVPINFSEHTLPLLTKAAEIAHFANAQLILLHVYHNPVFSSSVEKDMDQDLLKTLEKSRLIRLVRRIDKKYKELSAAVPYWRELSVQFIKTKGLLIDWIMDIARREKIDLIVMGTSGAVGIDEFWGTKAARVCMKTTTPTLVIPYKHLGSIPEKIAFVYDLKSIRRPENLDTVVLFSKIYHSEIHIATIQSEFKLNHREKENLTYLTSYFKEFDPVVHRLKGSDVEHELYRYLRSNNIGMLVALHRNRGLFEDLFKEDLTSRLVYHSRAQVLALDDREMA